MTHREQEDNAGRKFPVLPVWLILLALASLYGFIMMGQADSIAASNEVLATGAPQQSVVGLWHLADLTETVIYEMVVLILAVVTVGLMMASRPQQNSTVSAQPGPVETRTPEADI